MSAGIYDAFSVYLFEKKTLTEYISVLNDEVQCSRNIAVFSTFISTAHLNSIFLRD